MTDHTTDIPLKRCTKCNNSYPATREYFHVDKTGRDGLRAFCKLCAKVRDATRYSKDRARPKALNAKWRAENKEAQKRSNARRRAKYPERLKAAKAMWRAKNPEKVRAQNANWRAKNKEKAKGIAQRREARKRNLLATFTVTDWKLCLEYWDNRCAVCGRPQGLWHTLAQDHWIPLSRGGAYTPDNIIPLCHGNGGCNNQKHNRDAHEWLIDKFGARKAARIERRIRDYFASVSVQEQSA